MDSESPTVDCFVYAKHALGEAALGGVLFEDELVYAGHAYPPGAGWAYRGYLVAEPMRHAAGLGDLTDREAAALGLLVNRLARALKEVAEAEHVYSFVLGDGHAHLHVVLAPRYAAPRGSIGASGSESGPAHPGSARTRCGDWSLDSVHTSLTIEGWCLCSPGWDGGADRSPAVPGGRGKVVDYAGEVKTTTSTGLSRPRIATRSGRPPGYSASIRG